jgi:hypothetical protein
MLAQLAVLKKTGKPKATEGNYNSIVYLILGKAPFTMTAFRFLAKQTIKLIDPFFHLFQLLTWNLMCRGDSTQHVQYTNLTLDGDALCVVIPQHKGDQTADRGSTRDPKHCYCNPLVPEMDLFLALAIYFICSPEIKDSYLFPCAGSSTSRRGKGTNASYIFMHRHYTYCNQEIW